MVSADFGDAELPKTSTMVMKHWEGKPNLRRSRGDIAPPHGLPMRELQRKMLMGSLLLLGFIIEAIIGWNEWTLAVVALGHARILIRNLESSL